MFVYDNTKLERRFYTNISLTGSLLQRLIGHNTGIEIVYNPESQFILTHGSWTEEKAIRLWDKNSLTCMASYSLDKPVSHILNYWYLVEFR